MQSNATLDYGTPPQPITYRVGTLVYTRFALMSVFFWMLWGDLCVNIMETIIPRVVPLQLAKAGAAAATIAFVAASVPAFVELIINPFVSTYSDRYRSPLGRRRPFILFCTPILAACLIAVGFSDDLAPRLHALLGGTADGKALGMSVQTMTIVLLGALLAIFQIFNVVVLATYYYMIADVVPQVVIGKFAAAYRVVGTLGGVIFNKFIFRYADEYEWQIYVGCAIVYVVAFLLMGWRVKEGEYPPPPKLSESGSAVDGAKQWIRESFSIRFYQKFYLIGLFYWSAFTPSTIFHQKFALEDLKLSKAAAGDTFALALFVSLPLFFLLGWLSDKFHPTRVVIVGMALLGAASFGCYFFIHDEASFRTWTVVWTLAQTAYLGGQISLMPRMLPREQYGQYCSANNTLCAIGKFGAPFVCGLIVGQIGNRFNYLWTGACGFAGAAACVVLYLHWKRLGGDEHYTPPMLAHGTHGMHVKAAPVDEPGDPAVRGAQPVEASRVEAAKPDDANDPTPTAPR
ncbi:MAG TPA: MFS transporter [Tepidisphaeraceae bacterium]|nr:MFS transporter [Tepidisphaeraceae bacterium]